MQIESKEIIKYVPTDRARKLEGAMNNSALKEMNFLSYEKKIKDYCQFLAKILISPQNLIFV